MWGVWWCTKCWVMNFDCEGDRCRGCGIISDPFGSGEKEDDEEEKDDETVSRKVLGSHGEG